MISRYRGTADLQQSAPKKVQKDPVFSQLPERYSRYCREECTVWIQFTVCFSVGGKAAHVLDAEGKQISRENIIYPSFLLQEYILHPLKWEQGSANRSATTDVLGMT